MGKHHIKCLGCNFVCVRGKWVEKNEERKVYALPSDNVLREIWLRNLNRCDLINQKISLDYRVCEKHFTDDMLGVSKKRTIKNAIPTKVIVENTFPKVVIPETTEIMKRDNSTCCTSYTNKYKTESSRDSNIAISKKLTAEPTCSDNVTVVPLSKTCNLSLAKKRKKIDDFNFNIGEVKSKKQSIVVIPKIASVSTLAKTTQQPSVLTTTSNLSRFVGKLSSMQCKTNQTIVQKKNLNTIAKIIHPPTNYRIQNLSNIQCAESAVAVKIVQLPQQNLMQIHSPNQLATPSPPLLIRNCGLQIRPHVNVLNGQQSLNFNPNHTSPTVQLGIRQTDEHAPVYHNIGEFYIDLNSAAQHDSIRLPNGKLIQVKKSTINNPNMRQQIPNGFLTPIQNQPHHQFTITQSAGPLSTVSSANSNQVTIQSASIQQHHQFQSIQTVPASSILPNVTGEVQIINGKFVQMTPPNISGQTMPFTVNYPKNKIENARSQLQTQINIVMEICQHLSTKLQTLISSNPYKNANSLGDVKELYIHLSYLLIYGLGRLKSMQDKVAEDMSNMQIQPSTEKYSSDGDEDQMEIIEPKITTINLDPDNEDSNSSSIIVKDCTAIDKNLETKPANQSKQVVRKQIQNFQQRATSTPGYKLIAPKTWQTNKEGKEPSLQFVQQTPQQNQNTQGNLHNSVISEEPNSEQQNVLGNIDEYNTLSLLTGMLGVELSEDDVVKVQSTLGKKKPRKKLVKRPNLNLIKQNEEYNKIKIQDLKKNDAKLKQNCTVHVLSLDKKSDYFQEVFNRFRKYCKHFKKESQANEGFLENKDISNKTVLTQENEVLEFQTDCSSTNDDYNSKTMVNEANLSNINDSDELKENDCEIICSNRTESEESTNFEWKEDQIISNEFEQNEDEMKDNNVCEPEEKQIQIYSKDSNISIQSEENKDICSKDIRDSKSSEGKENISISKESEEKLDEISETETKFSKESEEVMLTAKTLMTLRNLDRNNQIKKKNNEN